MPNTDATELKQRLQEWAQELGFQQVGVAAATLDKDLLHFKQWLKNQYHGEMGYMETRAQLRCAPQELVPDTLSVISLRMNYVPENANFDGTLTQSHKANISRYALGRDYHKLMRKRLAKLAEKIKAETQHFDYRVFVDSAPVLERAYAQQAGIGWIGKNAMLINPEEGSFFFLGEIYTNLPLEADKPQTEQCGACTSCINLCPTQAIVAPYQIDARRCISYLTIELKGSIPEEFRPLIGNRIYGCDDCQLVCPWNRFAKATDEQDFHPRHQLQNADLLTLFAWTEEEFLRKTEGSPIRRIGHDSWQRNLAVALGNAAYQADIIKALQARLEQTSSAMVKEHIQWALEQQEQRAKQHIPVFVEAKEHKKLVRTSQKLLRQFH
ncbi:tRNA epoxyqueuosine(34) reductase QueG [Pleionea sp. CnH1-48]|uniref:tRNA epoxyqueuosine(34) reductase QueG n=1 Tax=Pleionea sp. CnH1-48 TaxID=2954494 RepID=UPI00209850BB|nr:tRNA epoxyqueuosine(34) reductase QueG [Pleionea sp. CnH1-48]MCO7223692.1 tRNA epoxyqueuosine(34) reductase QueG [Pleionea sp. CnH1-48]